jgi:hypothetical protein
MAIRWAVTNNGDADTGSTWDGGTVPGPADDVYLNALNVNVAAGSDITWASLSSASNVSPAITGGGSLTITAARNLSITQMLPRTDGTNNSGMIQITASTGTVSITGAANGAGTGATSYCIGRSGNCNFVFNGSILPRTGASAAVINIAGTGTATATLGSSGSRITFANAVSPGVTVNNSNIVFEMWADQFHGGAGTALALTNFSTAYTNGTCYGGATGGRAGISTTAAAGTHTHVGDSYSGIAGSNSNGIAKSGTSNLIVTGNAISNTTYVTNPAINVTAGGAFTFTGDVILGPATPLSVTGGTFTLNIGSITRATQSSVAGVVVGTSSTGVINCTNTLAGGTGGTAAAAISIQGTGGKQLIAPLIQGGGIASCPGVVITQTAGTVTIDANAIGTDFNGANGINVTGVGCTVVVNGKVTGNGYGVGSAIAGPAAGVSVSVLSTVSVREIESGPRGQCGIIGPVMLLSSPLNKSTTRQAVAGATTELVPAGAGSGGIQSYGFIY